MLKKLIVKHFQKHKEKQLNFTKGINAIIGETDQGKSAIVRALYLILENLPRGADKIFHKHNSKQPMEIIVEDFQGNVVKRKKKKYYLNGELFKAFNKDVPQPIRKLFPLKTINWHKQLDGHFLILNTSGNAAKQLGVSTGLEEQEEIIKEIKARLSDSKSELKRLQENNYDNKRKIKELRPVVSLLLQARNTKGKQNQLEELQEQVLDIQEIVSKVKKLEAQKSKCNIEQYLSYIKETLQFIKTFEENIQQQQNLVDILDKLKDTENIPATILESYLSETKQILKLLPALNEQVIAYNEVQQTSAALKNLIIGLNKTKNNLAEKEKEKKELVKNMGMCSECPLL